MFHNYEPTQRSKTTYLYRKQDQVILIEDPKQQSGSETQSVKSDSANLSWNLEPLDPFKRVSNILDTAMISGPSRKLEQATIQSFESDLIQKQWIIQVSLAERYQQNDVRNSSVMETVLGKYEWCTELARVCNKVINARKSAVEFPPDSQNRTQKLRNTRWWYHQARGRTRYRIFNCGSREEMSSSRATRQDRKVALAFGFKNYPTILTISRFHALYLLCSGQQQLQWCEIHSPSLYYPARKRIPEDDPDFSLRHTIFRWHYFQLKCITQHSQRRKSAHDYTVIILESQHQDVHESYCLLPVFLRLCAVADLSLHIFSGPWWGFVSRRA